MTFQTLDGKKWKIWWKYDEVLYPVLLHRGIVEMAVSQRTICYIKKVEDLNSEDVKIGWTDCSPSDKFTKEVGRKISLTRALEAFSERENRRAAWRSYLAR